MYTHAKLPCNRIIAYIVRFWGLPMDAVFGVVGFGVGILSLIAKGWGFGLTSACSFVAFVDLGFRDSSFGNLVREQNFRTPN